MLNDFDGCFSEDFNFFGLLFPFSGNLGLLALPFSTFLEDFGLAPLSCLRELFGLELLSDLREVRGLLSADFRFGLPFDFLFGLELSECLFGERFGDFDFALCTSALIVFVFCLPSSFTAIGW